MTLKLQFFYIAGYFYRSFSRLFNIFQVSRAFYWGLLIFFFVKSKRRDSLQGYEFFVVLLSFGGSSGKPGPWLYIECCIEELSCVVGKLHNAATCAEVLDFQLFWLQNLVIGLDGIFVSCSEGVARRSSSILNYRRISSADFVTEQINITFSMVPVNCTVFP